MYLGIDLGTSGLRALLTDAEGKALGSAEASYSNPRPFPGWSEQDPNDWISACEKAFDSLQASYPRVFEQLRGIGLSGQMHGATLIDDRDQVLRPCILWNDTRASAEAAALDAAPEMREISGNIVFPGFTAPKLMWLAKHEPDLFAKISKVLLPKDFLRLWLTGEHVGEMSDAAGTSWLDTGGREWSPAALAFTGMRRDQMPDLVEGSEVSGTLRDTLRNRWGIKRPVVVAGGAGDNAAAACGAGCFAESTGFVSLGTSGVLLAAKANYAPDPASAVHSFCHAVPDRWYQMGVILAATDCLNWYARLVGQKPADLAGRMPSQLSGPSPVTFLPYISGERTPHNDATLRGGFIGIDAGHDTDTLTAAVMEGVSFALRDNLEALRATGTELKATLAMGGGSQSLFWLKSLATILDLPLSVPKDGEFGAALGAARLAIVADGAAAIEEVMTPPDIAAVIEPDVPTSARYEARYRRFRDLYTPLHDYSDGTIK